MSKSTQIDDPQQALSSYFEEMLLGENNSNEQSTNTLTLGQLTEKERLNNDDWQKYPFQALLVNVQGLQLAIPSEHINGILTWPADIKEKKDNLEGWNMGSYGSPHPNINIINTSKIILPVQYQDPSRVPEFVIVLANSQWGLACHQINKTVQLTPDSIKWRQDTQSRLWLAGTLLEKKYSILSINGLIKQIES
ncbi:MAG: hypothetical protein COA90_00500 [Gammaproteobacteria bacterium]|nr:MAG: hypothetical protein COA90_00500 [Gammaproteobacteria bacterium]